MQPSLLDFSDDLENNSSAALERSMCDYEMQKAAMWLEKNRALDDDELELMAEVYK